MVIKEQIAADKIIMFDCNTILSSVGWSNKQTNLKVNFRFRLLYGSMDLTDIYKIFCCIATDYTFLPIAIFQDIKQDLRRTKY
jgi:hypothetical protein